MERKHAKIAALLVLVSSCLTLRAQDASVTKAVEIIKHKQNYPNYVIVAAHRGYWADYPENSAGAYEAAMDIGVDMLEMDVRVTQDGKMVVFHDSCLDRVTTGTGRLRDTPWSEIQSLKLKMTDGTVTQDKMLAFEEALDILKGRAVVSIDIKEGEALFRTVFVKVLKLLKSKGMLGYSVVKGKLTLSELTPLLAEAGVTLDDFIYTPVAFSNTKDIDSYIRDYVDTGKIYAIELVYKQSSDAILQYVPLMDSHNIWIGQYSFWPETADGVFAEKSPLTDSDPMTRDYDFKDMDPANPLDDGRGDWDWLLLKGADYIITDRSELMIDYLRLKGLREK